jgi:hypothetical protein
MRLAVYGLGSLFIGGLHQAVHPAASRVVPVPKVLNAVRILRREIRLVRLFNALSRQSFNLVVHIQKQGHVSEPPTQILCRAAVELMLLRCKYVTVSACERHASP